MFLSWIAVCNLILNLNMTLVYTKLKHDGQYIAVDVMGLLMSTLQVSSPNVILLFAELLLLIEPCPQVILILVLGYAFLNHYF